MALRARQEMKLQEVPAAYPFQRAGTSVSPRVFSVHLTDVWAKDLHQCQRHLCKPVETEVPMKKEVPQGRPTLAGGGTKPHQTPSQQFVCRDIMSSCTSSFGRPLRLSHRSCLSRFQMRKRRRKALMCYSSCSGPTLVCCAAPA